MNIIFIGIVSLNCNKAVIFFGFIFYSKFEKVRDKNMGIKAALQRLCEDNP